MKLLERVGSKTLIFLKETGGILTLLVDVFRNANYLWRDRALLIDQMILIGVSSLPLVAIVGVFAGAVAAWQAAYQFQGTMLDVNFLGSATSTAIVIELGPVLTGIVIAGRIGASIAAELGTMRVTEQIDALDSLAINPIRFLATPRVIAAMAMLPVIVIFADFIAIMGAYVVSNVFFDVSGHVFFGGYKKYFVVRDVMAGLVKAFVFGTSTAVIGCYVGFNASGGAEGVGKAAIRAFVLSSAMILVNDYVVATVMF